MAKKLIRIGGKLLRYGDKLLGERVKVLDPVLANNTWADIQKGLRNGNPQGWEVGDTKPVTLSNGDTYTARLVDLNKGRYQDTNNVDNVAVFEFVELITGIGGRAMNSAQKTYDGITSLTAGGWLSSDLRASMNGSSILGLFPEDLTSVMLNTKVGSAKYGGSGQADTTNGGVIIYSDGDKVFVGGASEYFGAGANQSYYRAYDTERTLYPQWDYYKTHDTNADRVKQELGVTYGSSYWNRSPNYKLIQSFCDITSGGSAINSDAYETFSLAPCFCL